jgi:gag-polyprotein putative aspartyl protease
MPVHSVHPIGNPNATPPDLLFHFGLLLQVEISVPQSLASVLTATNQQIPATVTGSALVDTGATCCCVEETFLQQLNLQPIAQVPMSGATGNRIQNAYQARLSFPGTPIPPLEIQVVGVQMNQGQTICLLGRDILRYCVLIYNGPQGSYTIAF